MAKKRIGFIQKETGEENNEGGDFFFQMHAKKKAETKQFIEQLYAPDGDTEAKNFITSLEIEYLLRESIDTSTKAINEVMNEMGFRICFIEGKPHWEVYQNMNVL